MYFENNTPLLNCQFNPQPVVNGHGRSCEPSIETMTSTQLADMLDMDKSHVNRDIKKMFEDRIRLSIIGSSKDSRGYVTDYHLPELESKMFVAKKDISYLEKITRFWINRGLNDPATLRSLLLTNTEKVLALEETVQTQAPKVAAFDRIATADGSMNITAAAKHLQIRPKDLFGWLSEHKWIYRRNGNKSWLAYQTHIQQGLLEHKINSVVQDDGVERVYEQVRLTPKGIVKLAQAFETALMQGFP